MSGLLVNLPFFKKEPRPLPATIATDEVIPVHLFDDSAAARGIVIVSTYKFDEVLDSDKLYRSLSQLFQMPGWRRFGGRFRYRVSTLQIKIICFLIFVFPPTDCVYSQMAIWKFMSPPHSQKNVLPYNLPEKTMILLYRSTHWLPSYPNRLGR